MININLTLIIQLISFLILVFVLKKILFDPLIKILDKRAKKVKDTESATKNAHSQKEKLDGQYRSEIYLARIKTRDLQNQAEVDVKIKRDELIKKKKEGLENQLKDLKDGLEKKFEKEKARAETQISLLSEEVANKIIGQ